jgi:hypothetical protein
MLHMNIKDSNVVYTFHKLTREFYTSKEKLMHKKSAPSPEYFSISADPVLRFAAGQTRMACPGRKKAFLLLLHTAVL